MGGMDLQKRLAADVMGCSAQRIRFDVARLAEISEAITKEDIRKLIATDAIRRWNVQGVSRARAKVRHVQNARGRRRGQGSRKGKASARQDPKDEWMATIRKQRLLLKTLKEKGLVTNEAFRDLRAKAKGRFFRSTRHIKLYVSEQGLIVKK